MPGPEKLSVPCLLSTFYNEATEPELHNSMMTLILQETSQLFWSTSGIELRCIAHQTLVRPRLESFSFVGLGSITRKAQCVMLLDVIVASTDQMWEPWSNEFSVHVHLTHLPYEVNVARVNWQSLKAAIHSSAVQFWVHLYISGG